MALLGGAPDLVPPEETAALIQCLEDETLLRLFPDRTDRPDRAAERGDLDVCSQWIRKLRPSLRDARHARGVQ